MTRILVFGSAHNASRIARLLDATAPDVRAMYVPPGGYARLVAAPPREDRVVLVRTGFRVGADTPRGRLFDAFWSRLRRSLPDAGACHVWLGTDVGNTVAAHRAGTLRRGPFLAARDDLHLAVAPWLASELESVGLPATTVLLPPPQAAPSVAPPLPAAFTVLSYVPAVRFAYYGGPTLLEVARRMPDVRFDVLGSRGEAARPATANVRWRGWVEDVTRAYAEATAVVRIPEHDGFGNTVIEGLQHARHVVYTQDVPFIRRVRPGSVDALAGVLGELRDAHATGQLALNLAGREYALGEFDPGRLTERLASLVCACGAPVSR